VTNYRFHQRVRLSPELYIAPKLVWINSSFYVRRELVEKARLGVLTTVLMKIQVFWDVTLCRMASNTDLSKEHIAILFSGSSSLVTAHQSIWRNIPEDFHLYTSLDTGRHSLLSGSNNGPQFAQRCFGYVLVCKEGVGPSKHNWFMYYSLYYAHDDMFRPL
jgi:hypothetical protein